MPRSAAVRPLADSHRGSRPRSLAGLLLLPLVVLALPAAALAQHVRSDVWITDGGVTALARAGNTLYLGGTFTRLAPWSGACAAFRDGLVDPLASFPPARTADGNGEVRAIAGDGLGGWYIGGVFDSVGGQPRHNLAHILPTLAVDAWNPGADSLVTCLAVAGATGTDFWAHQSSGTTANLRSIWGNATVTFAVGEGGVIRRKLGSSWASATSGTTNNLYGVRVNSSSLAIAVGANGTVLGYNGSSWAPITSGTTATLFGVWMGTLYSYAVGASGTILRYDGSSIVPMTSGTTATLLGVWASGASNVLAVGGAGTILRWNGSTWSPMTSGTTNILHAIWGTSSSNVYAAGEGGTILHYNGSAWSAVSSPTTSALTALWGSGASDVYAVGTGGTIVHFDGTGWSSMSSNTSLSLYGLWGTGASNIYADGSSGELLHHGLTVYAGGRFTQLGAAAHACIGEIDGVSGAVSTWDPNCYNLYGACRVDAIALTGDLAYVGGQFSAIGGAGRNNLGAVLLTTGAANTFDPYADKEVLDLVLDGGTLYASGSFQWIGLPGGVTRLGVAAIDVATGIPTAWAPNSPSLIGTKSIVRYANALIAGGGYPRLQSIDVVSGAISAWNPAPDGDVRDLATVGSTLYVGGSFSHLGGQAREGLAALDLTTGLVTAWSPTSSVGIEAVGTYHTAGTTTVCVGGTFRMVGGIDCQGLAALDLTTGAATGWAPSVNGGIFSLLVHGDALFVGGAFTSIAGQPRTRAASFGLADGLLTAWNPNVDGDVGVLAADGTAVYLSGGFAHVDGTARCGLAAVDRTSAALLPFDPRPDGSAAAMMVSGGRLYFGGIFLHLGSCDQYGTYRKCLAAVDATSGHLDAWYHTPYGPGPYVAPVYAILFGGGQFYVAGSIVGVDLIARGQAAAFDVATGALTAWDPGADDAIHALALAGPTVYLGGSFATVGGQPRAGVAAVDATSGAVRAWRADATPAVVSALDADGQRLCVGGGFTDVGGVARGGLAVIVDPSIAVDVPEGTQAFRLALAPCAPQPLHGSGLVRFELPAAGAARLTLFDVAGRRVRALLAGDALAAGPHEAALDARGLRPGVYVVRLEAAGERLSRRLVVVP